METPEHLQNLALSDTGFLFDPTTGNTYTLNETGTFLLKLLKEGKSKEEMLEQLLVEFEVDAEQAERDVTDLLLQLREFGLHQ